jgi:hypothetical protein
MNPHILKRFICVLIFIILFYNTTSSGNVQDDMKQIKKAIVFLGTVNEKNEPRPYATGFLVNIQGIFHLVTAKHVVVEMKDDKFTNELCDANLCVFFNTKDKKIGIRPIKEIKAKFHVDWIFHDMNDVDIALIPFGLDAKNDDVTVVSDKLFWNMDRLFELYDVFFLSYQPGINYQEKISPIARTGTISLINDDKTFYIDGFCFPGNSGSPLFLKPSPIRFDANSISIGNDPLSWKFIGIIGSYIPYQEVAISLQTGRPRVIFEENTGLSKVWSTTYINKIIESDKFKKQIEKLLKK